MSDDVLQVLSPEERQRASAFVKEEEREGYLLSHLYLRRILTHYVPEVAISEWRFRHNRYGKPAIANVLEKKHYFNLSHTRSCAYVIVSDISECGIDVEEKREIERTEGLCKLVFSEEELDEYAIIKEKESMFYRIWTVKEAHLKALGTGLMETSPEKLNFQGKIHAEEKYDHFSIGERHYWSQSLENDCFLAFCVLNSQKKPIPVYKNDKELN